MSRDKVFNHCQTFSAYVIDVYVDIDNPGNYYCAKCWEAYDANVAYLSTQNAALAITVANVLADMDKMKERMDKMKEHADRHWKETSCLEQKIKDLQFLLDYQVESLNFDRIRDLENEVDNYDAWLGGACQNERELHARIGELEAQIDGLRLGHSDGDVSSRTDRTRKAPGGQISQMYV